MNVIQVNDDQERLILAALKVAELNAEAFKDEATRNECGDGAAMMGETSRNFRTLREQLQAGELHLQVLTLPAGGASVAIQP